MNTMRATAGLLATAAVAVSATASAWDGPEHESMGRTAFQVACWQHPTVPACDRQNHLLRFGTHSRIAREATAEADNCHSIYFSSVGIELNNQDAASRRNCAIIDGVPYTDPGPYTTFGVNKYLMFTNKQHFGDHTRSHAAVYFQLALQAAQRYRTKPPLSAAADACSYAAIALAGFANHYVTDRTAAGHAWTPATHGMRWTTTPAYTVGMLGCFHDQVSTTKRIVIRSTTGFSCVDNGWFGERVWVGLGSQGRWFGGIYYNDEKPWWSDYQWEDNVKPIGTGSAMQRAETLSAARQIMDAVLTVMEGQAGNGAYDDTFVSNYDMCRVAWGLCCRKFDASTTCGSWSDPNVNVTPTCDYCLPDISHARLLEMCPYKKIRLAAESNGGVWKSVYGASVWHDYYAGSHIHSNPDWSGDYGYAVELDRPQGGWSGVTAARTLAGDNVGSLHPDAQWDQNNNVVTLLGCPP